MTKDKLNGSVDVLARAMRQVFAEAVESAVQPIGKRLDEGLSEISTRLDKLENQASYHQKALDGIKNRLPQSGRD